MKYLIISIVFLVSSYADALTKRYPLEADRYVLSCNNNDCGLSYQFYSLVMGTLGCADSDVDSGFIEDEDEALLIDFMKRRLNEPLDGVYVVQFRRDYGANDVAGDGFSGAYYHCSSVKSDHAVPARLITALRHKAKKECLDEIEVSKVDKSILEMYFTDFAVKNMEWLIYLVMLLLFLLNVFLLKLVKSIFVRPVLYVFQGLVVLSIFISFYDVLLRSTQGLPYFYGPCNPKITLILAVGVVLCYSIFLLIRRYFSKKG